MGPAESRGWVVGIFDSYFGSPGLENRPGILYKVP
jgi:hypothetical protein